MKKFITAGILLAAMASCGGNQAPAGDQTSEKIRLEQEAAQKDSLLNDLFASFNEISANLIEIKDREGIVTANVSPEIPKEKRAQIIEDIAAINDLLERNRASLVQLQNITEKLRSSNIQVKELELLISNFAQQIQEKDADILRLHEDLAAMEIQISTLTSQMDELQTDARTQRENLESQLEAQDDKLHRVYYLIGREKDLKDADIINKSGFIGRTVTMDDNYNLDQFTAVDSRDLDRIFVGQRKATIVTPHPADSYKLETGEKNLLKEIVITDPERFWETSKILVVSYK